MLSSRHINYLLYLLGSSTRCLVFNKKSMTSTKRQEKICSKKTNHNPSKTLIWHLYWNYLTGNLKDDDILRAVTEKGVQYERVNGLFQHRDGNYIRKTQTEMMEMETLWQRHNAFSKLIILTQSREWSMNLSISQQKWPKLKHKDKTEPIQKRKYSYTHTHTQMDERLKYDNWNHENPRREHKR